MLLRFLSPWIFALANLSFISAVDTVSSGRYLIHLCDSGHPNSQASILQDLLPRVWDGLQKVIADLERGTTSLHGYSTFFRDDSSKADVLRVYQKIAQGAAVAVGPARTTIRYPTFICVNNVPETDLLYSYCEPDVAMLMYKHTEIVPLCPLFWKIQEQAIKPDCPLVIANTLSPNDDRLLHNQEALLVGALMRLYHDVREERIHLITDASELDASESLLNPPNYAFYYAAVQAGCTSFPNMQEPHDELRHLLEVPINSSEANATMPMSSEIPSSVRVMPDLNVSQDFCNDAVYAPNATVCCDESTGLWMPAPVIRDGPAASSMSASCPQSTGGTGGVGAGSGVINTRRRRKTKA